MVTLGNFLGKLQKAVFRPQQELCSPDGVAANSGMSLHYRKLLHREFAGLEQNAVGNAHFADIVQRRRAHQKLNAFRRQNLSITAPVL